MKCGVPEPTDFTDLCDSTVVIHNGLVLFNHLLSLEIFDTLSLTRHNFNQESILPREFNKLLRTAHQNPGRFYF